MGLQSTGARVRAAALLFVTLCLTALPLTRAHAQANNRAPTITCPGPQTVECASPQGTQAMVTVQVADQDGNALTVRWTVDNTQVQVDNVPAGGANGTSASVSLTHTFADGNHTVHVTVSDGSQTASCDTSVNVVDTTPPTVRCSLRTTVLWPPNHQLVNVGLSAMVHDVCDPSPTVQVTVFSNQDDLAPGSGNFAPDATNIAPGTLQLRSERSGQDKTGRIYLIVITATDDAGNVGHDCCTVVVPHDQSRRSINTVLNAAAAVRQACMTSTTPGTPPAGFVLVGDASTNTDNDNDDDNDNDHHGKDKDKGNKNHGNKHGNADDNENGHGHNGHGHEDD